MPAPSRAAADDVKVAVEGSEGALLCAGQLKKRAAEGPEDQEVLHLLLLGSHTDFLVGVLCRLLKMEGSLSDPSSSATKTPFSISELSWALEERSLLL